MPKIRTQSPERLQEITAVLSRTPGVLRSLLDGLPEAWLTTREAEDTFSPRDVVGHLIEGEKTDWIPRARLILESGDTRAFVPFDRLGFQEAIEGRGIGDLLMEFGTLRERNLAVLQGLALTPPQLSLRGKHPALGPVTLGQLLSTWAVHDLNHIGQIVRVMSGRYDGAVGPWKAYLGILNR
jgi:hypothetical protein